jgi:hypothetical protein
MSVVGVLAWLTAALAVLLAGLVAALVRIRTVVAVLVLALLVLLRLLRLLSLLLAQMRLILLPVPGGFALIVIGIVSHGGSFSITQPI